MAKEEKSEIASLFTNLARRAVEEYVKNRRIIKLGKNVPVELKKKAGVFVSIHTKEGALRGCIGTIYPNEHIIAELIVENAIAAATRDPRFLPISKEELPDLVYKVDILSASEIVENINMLDPKKYGVIVETVDGRRGLLLPDLEGVDSVEKQLDIACQKAGIFPGEKYKIYKFTVDRYEEKS